MLSAYYLVVDGHQLIASYFESAENGCRKVFNPPGGMDRSLREPNSLINIGCFYKGICGESNAAFKSPEGHRLVNETELGIYTGLI